MEKNFTGNDGLFLRKGGTPGGLTDANLIDGVSRFRRLEKGNFRDVKESLIKLRESYPELTGGVLVFNNINYPKGDETIFAGDDDVRKINSIIMGMVSFFPVVKDAESKEETRLSEPESKTEISDAVAGAIGIDGISVGPVFEESTAKFMVKNQMVSLSDGIQPPAKYVFIGLGED